MTKISDLSKQLPKEVLTRIGSECLAENRENLNEEGYPKDEDSLSRVVMCMNRKIKIAVERAEENRKVMSDLQHAFTTVSNRNSRSRSRGRSRSRSRSPSKKKGTYGLGIAGFGGKRRNKLTKRHGGSRRRRSRRSHH